MPNKYFSDWPIESEMLSTFQFGTVPVSNIAKGAFILYSPKGVDEQHVLREENFQDPDQNPMLSASQSFESFKDSLHFCCRLGIKDLLSKNIQA